MNHADGNRADSLNVSGIAVRVVWLLPYHSLSEGFNGLEGHCPAQHH